MDQSESPSYHGYCPHCKKALSTDGHNILYALGIKIIACPLMSAEELRLMQ